MSPKSIPALQATLTDLIDLALITKQAHWNVHGTSFRAVHLHLDELVEQILDWQDEIAERIVAIGGSPDGRSSAVVKNTRVAPITEGAISDAAVVKYFAERLTALSQATQATFGDLEDDLVSQDVLIGTVAGLDKAAWMFRSQIG
ncbi:MAG: DNA starvation/stationary phase protection protein [Propionibacteriaceae bacterium]|jgi:starvation-inducible DNA-binding protein|nr:DNA starvation/stationary phase protection protein [Propionibacteriaceae bacterium]